MKIAKLFFFFLTPFWVFSCKSSKPSCIVTTTTPKSGNEIIVKKIDTCNNNVLSEESNIRYSKDSLIRTGYYKEFYKNGNLKTFGFFKNGYPDSVLFKYYRNGEKEEGYYRYNGQLSGAQYRYYKNGMIKSVIFAKSDTMPLFFIHFDKNGNIDTTSGKVIHLVLRPGYQKLEVGHTLEIVNILCLFRNTVGQIRIKLKRYNAVVRDTTVYKFNVVGRQPFCLFKYKFNQKGNYKYIAIAKIWVNGNHNLIKEDTEVIRINVL